MKKLKFTIVFLLSFSTYYSSFSQVKISSKDGYDVIITIKPASVFVYGSSCKWGYNYDIDFDYKIDIIGNNKPVNLYTLQGYIYTKDASLFFDLPKKESNGSGRTKGRAWTNQSDCSTTSVEDKVLGIIILEIEGPGIPHQMVTYGNTSSLPIELLTFSASRNSDLISFDWTTASETNNDFFTIEGSVDGISFEPLSIVKGAGNSNTFMSYQKTINDRVNKYARLKQTDFDGKFSYSKLINIAIPDNQNRYSIYPNPNQGNVLMFDGENPELINLSIYSISGSLLSSFDLTSSKVEMPNLIAGVYFLTFMNKQTKETEILKYIQK